MSELIQNREFRKQELKKIIQDLHDGKPVPAVKARFDAIADHLDPGELSRIEQEMISEGLPISEVQRLCSVHAAVFKDALETAPEPKTTPGHPVHTFLAENRALENLIHQEIEPLLKQLESAGAAEEPALASTLAEKLNLLADVDKHYSRKENLVFPYLEKYEISGPPKVMWGVDDEIRAELKKAKASAARYQSGARQRLLDETRKTLDDVTEMIFKEEKIFFPMALDTLSEDEWFHIYQDSDEIGYCLYDPQIPWQPVRVDVNQKEAIADEHTAGSNIKFATGVLSPEEISLIFNHLPVDITFVDKNDTVKYFSNGTERIFPRTRTIIGRKVENCHPPASVHVVEKLVDEFKSGAKDQADFWLHVGDKYVLIRYFAVRDEHGDYAGTLEVSQDIKPIQQIEGEKRIAD